MPHGITKKERSIPTYKCRLPVGIFIFLNFTKKPYLDSVNGFLLVKQGKKRKEKAKQKNMG